MTAATNFSTFAKFITPGGQQALVEWIQRIRREQGAEWLETIKTDFPTASWFVDLVANYTAEEAVDHLTKEYGKGVYLVGGQIKTLHAKLREEIDKPR